MSQMILTGCRDRQGHGEGEGEREQGPMKSYLIYTWKHLMNGCLSRALVLTYMFLRCRVRVLVPTCSSYGGELVIARPST